MCRWGLVLALLLVLASPGDRVSAARRSKKTAGAKRQRVVAGRRDQQSCAVGGRGWQVAPLSRFEEDVPSCQYDTLTMEQAGEVFAEKYEGRRPLIVTGATANLPPGAFSRQQLVEEHGERRVAVGTSHGIPASSGTGDEMVPLAKFVAEMEAGAAPFLVRIHFQHAFIVQTPLIFWISDDKMLK